MGILQGTVQLLKAATPPAWASFADAYRNHRLVLSTCLVAATGLHCLLPLCPSNVGSLFVLLAMSETFAAPIQPLSDSAILLTLRRCGLDPSLYGRQRLWGSVGWGFVFAPLIGLLRGLLVGRSLFIVTFSLHASCNAVGLLAVRRLAQPGDPIASEPADTAERQTADAARSANASAENAECAHDFGVTPDDVAAVPPSASALAVLGTARAALRHAPGALPRFALFLVFGSLMGLFDTYLFALLEEQGAPSLLDGLAMTVSCGAEARSS